MFRSLSTAVLLLLFALPSVALAQNTGKLSGRVTDADTGDPLIGANVYLADVQRGAATDINGNYTILGIPVGQYDVQYSYTGYQPQTLTGVELSQGRTRTVDIELSPQSIGEVIVEYERPLIQRDAIGVPKVATGEDIQNLPVRGVSSVAAIQSGVVSNDGSSTLNIRGGRGEEVAYYVDGVKVLGGSPAVPQQAIAEQEMLIGTIPPQYGDATAGVISISTRSGGNTFFGAAEAITSYGLDDYGYNLGALSLGGPLLRDKVSFFASIQGTYAEDSSPWALETLQLNDDLYNQIQSSPQVLRVSREVADAHSDDLTVSPLFQDDQFVYLPFPSNFTLPSTGAVTPDSLAGLLGLGAGSELQAVRPAYSLFNSTDQFSSRSAKDDPSTQIATTGNIEFRPVQGVNLRLGGAYTYDEDRGFSYDRSFFNRDRFSTSEDTNTRGYASLRQVLSNTAFYQIQAEFSARDFVSYPEEFGSNIEDILSYGDIEAPQNEVAARYFRLGDIQNPEHPDDPTDRIPAYIQQFDDGSINPSSSLGFVFSGPGTALSNYQQFNQSQFRVFGSAQTQVGLHELSFGGEYETLTQRNWSIGGASRSFAAFFEDADGPETPLFNCDDTGEDDFTRAPSCLSGDDFRGDGDPATLDAGVDSYDQLPFGGANIQGLVNYYGYDYLGLNEVDSENVAGYASGTNTNIAPYKPIYYGGFLRDRIEFQDIVLDLGLRVDVFDNNTLVLKDPYALVDIYRVEDLSQDILDANGDVLVNATQVPAGIGADFAFYQNAGNVIGYRDLEGRFYDATGEQVANPLDIQSAGGAVGRASGLTDAAFEDYDPALTIMPRIGVTFPVTDRALFFASYNVTSQRPSENAFATLRDYANTANSSGTLNNSNLRPETTTQYELGFRQRVGQQAALTLSGFYRTQRNKITLRNLNEAFPAGYTTYTNLDFSTTKGVEVAFDLRRTRNLAVNANYTLSFAEGTGSDSRTARIIAWRSQTGVFPETLAPLAFDRRHNLNVSLDYRLGDGEGPMVSGIHPLAGFGFNLLGVVQSGSPYTELDQQALESPVLQSTNGGAVGTVNSVYLPFTSRVDLKVDRAFNLGPAAFRGYVWVQNLLDQDQVYSVYRDTGLPDNDGFLSTNPDAVRALPTELERDAFRFLYSQYVDSPVVLDAFGVSGGQVYGLPRRIRLGVTLDF